MSTVQFETVIEGNVFDKAGFKVVYSGDPDSPVSGDYRFILTGGCYQERYNGSAWVQYKESVYAYLTASEGTTITDADSWYRLEGIFSNTISDGFTADANGITYNGNGNRFEVEFNLCGQTDKTARICTAMVLNAVFDVNGKMTSGTLLNGSIGSAQSDVIGATDGYINCHSLWAGSIATGERLSLVIQSNVAGTTVTSNSASASLHIF